MRDLKAWAKVSLRELEKFALTRGETLPRSTIGRLLSAENIRQMPTAEQLAVFVLGCGLSEKQWREWAKVWSDVRFSPARKRPVVTIRGGKYRLFAVGKHAQRFFDQVEDDLGDLIDHFAILPGDA